MGRFLVTGGAGFIGSNLAEALCDRGESVRILDDFSTGKRENIAHLLGRVEVIEGTVCDLAVCRRAVAGVEYVLHQAALPSVPRSIADPLASNQANVTGTLALLSAAHKAGVKRFVYASSSSVYGDTPILPKVETMTPCPLSPYAAGKLAGEIYAGMFYRLHGLGTVSLRYFNVFGPRQDPASQYAAVVPRFVTSFLEGASPVIYGDGEQSRDFTYVGNVVAANLLACAAPDDALGQAYNCACGGRLTINELAGALKTLTGSKATIEYGEPRPGDVRHSWADIGKAAAAFGYEPRVPVEAGLEAAVAWYRDQRGQSRV